MTTQRTSGGRLEGASRIAAGSLAVGLAVLALKAYAAWATGSVALYADALESVVNIVTAVAALVAVRFAARPADAGLPYGYHKAEYFSAVIIGVFIVVAAILVGIEAWRGFFNPQPVQWEAGAIAVSVLATAINMGWALHLGRQGRRLRSPSLVADSRHLMTDVVSTIGVLVGVGLVLATGWHRLDSILAALVAVNILWSGWQVMRESVGGLMDVAVEPERLGTIRRLIAADADGAIEAHDVRTRQAGRIIFIDFHLVVPGAMTVEAAHAICDRIEATLREKVEGAQVTIHVEPENKAKHSGIVVL
jgi:cation diffusion facilitator family transporter